MKFRMHVAVVGLIWGWFAVVTASADQFGLFTYADLGTSIKITDYPVSAAGDVTVPAMIAGKPVTSIGNYAFDGCSGITSLTLPDGMTTIGNFAFQYCAALHSLSLPASITSIGARACYFCIGLTDLTLPAGLTSVG